MNKRIIKGELEYQLRYLEVARVRDGTLHMRNLVRRHISLRYSRIFNMKV